MKLYLDTCCLHRPLDGKSQIRIRLESEAVLALLTLCETGQANLVSSAVLTFEIDRNPNLQHRAIVHEMLAVAVIKVPLVDPIVQRATELETAGFKGLDALHLASAEAAQVDYFCTCDDRLLKKAGAFSPLQIIVRSPLELIQEITS